MQSFSLIKLRLAFPIDSLQSIYEPLNHGIENQIVRKPIIDTHI